MFNNNVTFDIKFKMFSMKCYSICAIGIVIMRKKILNLSALAEVLNCH